MRIQSKLMRLFALGLPSIAFLALILMYKTFFLANRFPISQLESKNQPALISFKPNEFRPQIDRLKSALTTATVTIGDDLHSPDQSEAFSKLNTHLQNSFPATFAELEITRWGNSILLKWNGSRSDLLPYLFIAHQDVVPIAAPAAWRHRPFKADEADGFIWARGSLDMKSALVAMLEGVEKLIQNHVKPARTLYFAFGSDEETGGMNGARRIAEFLRAKHIHFDSIFDEGLTILNDVMPGMKDPVALVGVAQKGFLTLELTVDQPGGHSSMPPRSSAIGRISRAVTLLERNPFPTRLTDPIRFMLESIAPFESFSFRVLFSNLWLTSPALLYQFAQNPQTAALIQTTTAATMISGGIRDNVLPPHASVIINFRLLAGDTVNEVVTRVRSIVEDPLIQITPQKTSEAEASRTSSTDGPAFHSIVQSVRSHFPTTVIAPSLMVGSADSRHYDDLTDNTYRFLPLQLSRSELSEIHGDNEKIGVENYRAMLSYYLELLQRSASSP